MMEYLVHEALKSSCSTFLSPNGQRADSVRPLLFDGRL